MKFNLSLMTAIVLVLLLSACSESPSNLHIKMNDGNVIYLRHDKVVHYDTQNDFLKSLSFVFNMNYSYLTNNHVNLKPDSVSRITGYDDRFIGLWEKASFGNWIENYGLQTNKVYYIASCVYVTYLPVPPDGYYLFPVVIGHDNIGLVPPSAERGAIVTTDKSIGFSIAKTGSLYIGYDENGNLIALEIPQLKNNITWKFLTKRNGWD